MAGELEAGGGRPLRTETFVVGAVVVVVVVVAAPVVVKDVDEDATEVSVASFGGVMTTDIPLLILLLESAPAPASPFPLLPRPASVSLPTITASNNCRNCRHFSA